MGLIVQLSRDNTTIRQLGRQRCQPKTAGYHTASDCTTSTAAVVVLLELVVVLLGLSVVLEFCAGDDAAGGAQPAAKANSTISIQKRFTGFSPIFGT